MLDTRPNLRAAIRLAKLRQQTAVPQKGERTRSHILPKSTRNLLIRCIFVPRCLWFSPRLLGRALAALRHLDGRPSTAAYSVAQNNELHGRDGILVPLSNRAMRWKTRDHPTFPCVGNKSDLLSDCPKCSPQFEGRVSPLVYTAPAHAGMQSSTNQCQMSTEVG